MVPSGWAIGLSKAESEHGKTGAWRRGEQVKQGNVPGGLTGRENRATRCLAALQEAQQARATGTKGALRKKKTGLTKVPGGWAYSRSSTSVLSVIRPDTCEGVTLL